MESREKNIQQNDKVEQQKLPHTEKKYVGRICFDVDGTLITYEDKPNYSTIQLLKFFQNLGWEVFIHSGSGIDYAKRWAEKLGLEPCTIRPKGDVRFEYDIAVDDAVGEEDIANNKLIKANSFIIV